MAGCTGLSPQAQDTWICVFKCHILPAYLGTMSVILCMAKVTLFSSLSWLLWCTKPFIIWCPLPWIKKGNKIKESEMLKLWGQS